MTRLPLKFRYRSDNGAHPRLGGGIMRNSKCFVRNLI
jgi:hypothetical protein